MTAPQQKTKEVQSGYDRVAEEYARHYYDELQHKPLDRQLLDRFAERVKDLGLTHLGQTELALACDLGCGPGQIARHLQGRGVAVCGLDLSLEMVAQARRLNPGIEFFEGSMLALPVKDQAWAGITAFYAIVNFPPADLGLVMREMWRVLRPGGWLLLSFHIGEQVEHVEDLWGCAVSLDFYFFGVEQVKSELQAAEFQVKEVIERGPYAPEVEYQSCRAYIFARRPPITE